jgi:tetratricopeptide (TPR) repeat protein
LPTDKTEIDGISKERNTAYYQLGLIYKEKFKEYELATAKLEKLLQNNPEEKLVLPTLYNLYKIYQITDAKAMAMKDRINNQYPNSRYAVIINDTNLDDKALADSPEKLVIICINCILTKSFQLF